MYIPPQLPVIIFVIFLCVLYIIYKIHNRPFVHGAI
uniref:Uncharacterized protein n=1 Tax=Abalone asfa-like virus TaxID=2839893 RepID=A0A5K7Y0Z5_9VIRU|nr:hypothetical protein [Abalone asfa-like virus]